MRGIGKHYGMVRARARRRPRRRPRRDRRDRGRQRRRQVDADQDPVRRRAADTRRDPRRRRRCGASTGRTTPARSGSRRSTRTSRCSRTSTSSSNLFLGRERMRTGAASLARRRLPPAHARGGARAPRRAPDPHPGDLGHARRLALGRSASERRDRARGRLGVAADDHGRADRGARRRAVAGRARARAARPRPRHLGRDHQPHPPARARARRPHRRHAARREGRGHGRRGRDARTS